MKASKLLLLMFCLFIGSTVYGQDYHRLNVCTVITNINDYPDITFLKVIIELGDLDPIQTSVITPNECQSSHGKMVSVENYAVNTGYLTDKDINSIDWTKDIHALRVPVPVYYWFNMLPNTNPLIERDEFYKIVGFTSNSVVVYLWKSVDKFNDGQADYINYYTYSGDTTGLSQTIFLIPHATQVSKTIHVITPGTLTSLLTDYEKETVTNLTVSGNIDARDVKCMRDSAYSLSILDLSDANIKEYWGNGGTSQYRYGYGIYSANCMQPYSFHNPWTLVGKSTLQTITLPATITTIGDHAFDNCRSLTDLTIPNLVTSIGDGAFYNCSGLTDLTLPNLVTSIGIFSFRNCSGLTHVSMGSGVTNIDDYAFQGCTGLQKITVACSLPPSISLYTFDGVNKETTILNVPIGSKEAYQTAPYSNLFLRINEITTGINEAFIPDQLVKVFGDHSDIMVEGILPGETIALYTSNGVQLQTIRSQGTRIAMHVQCAGVYLVRTASKTFKVVL